MTCGSVLTQQFVAEGKALEKAGIFAEAEARLRWDMNKTSAPLTVIHCNSLRWACTSHLQFVAELIRARSFRCPALQSVHS